MSEEIEEIIEDIDDLFEQLVKAVADIPGFVIESEAGDIELNPMTEPPNNYDYIYMPNLTSRGPSSKRFRFMERIDSHMEALRMGYCFATESDAKAAAQAMVQIFKKAL